MRVAGNLEIDVVFCRHISVVRFVYGENCTFALRNGIQRCGNVGMPIKSIIQACQPQSRAT